MARFTTISPSHVAGKKPYAWQQFLKGGYVAIGWLQAENLKGRPIEEIEELIQKWDCDNEANAIRSLERFLSLEMGDYVAVNNVNFGLFGVGVITSGYKFQQQKHDTGAENKDQFYSHYREVKWLATSYVDRKSLLGEDETGWQPYGAIGKLYDEVPPYVLHLLGTEPAVPPREQEPKHVRPHFLAPVIENIKLLRKDPQHQERGHESLVEEFFAALGYQKYKDIKYRRGRVDVTLQIGGRPVAIVEVKRAWDLSRYNGMDAVKQAYQYAHNEGVRYVVVTNGDNYLFYDRLKGLSWDANLVGEFSLTSLQEDDVKLVERLRPERLSSPNISELFQHLSKAFGQ